MLQQRTVEHFNRRRIGKIYRDVAPGVRFDERLQCRATGDQRREIIARAMTVTRVQAARNLRTAAVAISVYGHENDRGVILRKVANKAKELQALINRDLTLKYTPRLRFELDGSVEKGDHILDVLSHLETPADDDDGETPDMAESLS